MATGDSKGKGNGLSGQALKDFRSSVAKLKRKGIVSARVDARSQRATRYMRSKVRKFNDVLEGTAIAVKAPKAVRQKYIESETLPVRGSFVIAPASSARDRGRIKKGMIQTVKKLRNGQEETVYLPFKIEALPDLINRMIDEADSIDALKDPGEYFSFRIGENNSEIPFADAKDMAEYMVKYSTRLDHPIRSAKTTRELFTFQRFRTTDGQFMRNPHESGKVKKPFPAPDKRGRNARDTYYDTARVKARMRDAARKAKERAKETPAEKERRHKADALRSAQRRQRIFEGD